MEFLASPLTSFLQAVLFVAVIMLHVTKKNATAVAWYMVQSAAVVTLLLRASSDHFSGLLVLAVAATIAVKLIVGPYFFFSLIRKHRLTFSASTYASTPVTLLAIALLTAMTNASAFQPLMSIVPEGRDVLRVALASILIALLVTVNRKGALSQMIGVLALENSIVAFAVAAGLEQSPGLQLGITFDILIWIMIATVFASMIYRQFGTLDVTAMRRLTE